MSFADGLDHVTLDVVGSGIEDVDRWCLGAESGPWLNIEGRGINRERGRREEERRTKKTKSAIGVLSFLLFRESVADHPTY